MRHERQPTVRRPFKQLVVFSPLWNTLMHLRH